MQPESRTDRRAHRAAETARRRRRTYAVLAVVFAIAAVGSFAAQPRTAVDVPELDGVRGAVALRYAFAFPDEDDAPLERPVGVVAAGERVYVVDSTAGVVRVYDDRGVERGVVGTGVLDVPVYAAVDTERGVLYVTDRAKRALYLFGLDDGAIIGTLSPVADEGSSIATAWAPLAIAVGDSGALFVTDVLERHRVLALEPDGRITREIAGPQAAIEATGVIVALDFPNAVRATGDEVWVSDSNNKRALVFGVDGRFLRAVPMRALVRGFDFVPPLAGSAETTLVAFVDTLGSDISLVDLAGAARGRFGGMGGSAGRLAFPNDISVSAEGDTLYVADTGNRRVQVWDVIPADAGAGSALLPSGLRDGRVLRVIAVLASALALLMGALWLRTKRYAGGTERARVDTE